MEMHPGDLQGYQSQVSIMPTDSIGIIVFLIGDQGRKLRNILTFNIYERLLGMNSTPWNERLLKDQKQANEITKKYCTSSSDKVEATCPSHPLTDYTGKYENPGYFSMLSFHYSIIITTGLILLRMIYLVNGHSISPRIFTEKLEVYSFKWKVSRLNLSEKQMNNDFC
jgi:hypothetical protein